MRGHSRLGLCPGDGSAGHVGAPGRPFGGWQMRRKTKTAAIAFCALLVMAGAPESTSWSWRDAQESTVDKRQPETEAGMSSGRLYNAVFAARAREICLRPGGGLCLPASGGMCLAVPESPEIGCVQPVAGDQAGAAEPRPMDLLLAAPWRGGPSNDRLGWVFPQLGVGSILEVGDLTGGGGGPNVGSALPGSMSLFAVAPVGSGGGDEPPVTETLTVTDAPAQVPLPPSLPHGLAGIGALGLLRCWRR